MNQDLTELLAVEARTFVDHGFDAAEAEAFALAAIQMIHYGEFNQAARLLLRAVDFARSAA